MLLPRFKLRTALICLTATGFVSLLFREGARGTEWAIGATIGLASLILWLLLMALFFAASMLLRPSQRTAIDAQPVKGSFYTHPEQASPEQEEGKDE